MIQSLSGVTKLSPLFHLTVNDGLFASLTGIAGRPGPAGGAIVTVAGGGGPVGSGGAGRLYGNRFGPASTGGREAVWPCAVVPEPATSPSAIRVAAHRLLRIFPSPRRK